MTPDGPGFAAKAGAADERQRLDSGQARGGSGGKERLRRRGMANETHVERLKKGAKVWNRWREQNPDVQPNLRDADLSRARLRDTNLIGADLRGTILRSATLSGADLSGARLSEAALSGARLNRAHLSGASLRDADLSGADLSRATLSGADLSGADLSEALLYEMAFGNTDLSDARGLETCHHRGPSTLDSRTLARSGPLPLAFLRGCGLKDWEIEAAKLYHKGLSQQEIADITYRIFDLNTGNIIQYASCFISYSSTDEAFCKHLHDHLQEAGVRAWFAPEDMRGGQRIIKQVDQAIQINDKLLIVLTENSINSRWVRREISQAMAREEAENRDLLFPIRLMDIQVIRDWECFDTDTGIDIAKAVREYHILGDFERWQDPAAFDAAFQKLLRDLQADDVAGRA